MILIKNAYLLSMEDVNYEVCDILVKDGKIAKIGKLNENDYEGVTVIDAKERYVRQYNFTYVKSFKKAKL